MAGLPSSSTKHPSHLHVTHFPWFSLPQELRDKIYRLLPDSSLITRKRVPAYRFNRLANTLRILPAPGINPQIISKHFRSEYLAELRRIIDYLQFFPRYDVAACDYFGDIGAFRALMRTTLTVRKITLSLQDIHYNAAALESPTDQITRKLREDILFLLSGLPRLDQIEIQLRTNRSAQHLEDTPISILARTFIPRCARARMVVSTRVFFRMELYSTHEQAPKQRFSDGNWVVYCATKSSNPCAWAGLELEVIDIGGAGPSSEPNASPRSAHSLSPRADTKKTEQRPEECGIEVESDEDSEGGVLLDMVDM